MKLEDDEKSVRNKFWCHQVVQLEVFLREWDLTKLHQNILVLRTFTGKNCKQ